MVLSSLEISCHFKRSLGWAAIPLEGQGNFQIRGSVLYPLASWLPGDLAPQTGDVIVSPLAHGNALKFGATLFLTIEFHLNARVS